MKQPLRSAVNILKTRFRIVVRWCGSHRSTASLIFVAVIIILSGVVLALTKQAQNNIGDKSGYSMKNDNNSTTIHIDANIPGVTMAGTPHCDSSTLDKKTPYDCTLPEDETETIITAPKEVSHEGATYVFQSWDGCSESNEDNRVCRVDTYSNSVWYARATYIAENEVGRTTQGIVPLSVSAPEPIVSCVSQNLTNEGNGSCAIQSTETVRVQINTSFAPECDTYRAGIVLRCRNGVTYFDGRISPPPEFRCYSGSSNACVSGSLYTDVVLAPGDTLISIAKSGTFNYGLSSGQASLADVNGSYDTQSGLIKISINYVAPIKDESYPACCTP